MAGEIFDRDKFTRIKTLLKLYPKGLTITEISQKLKLSRISVSKYLDILLISGQVEMKMYGVAKAFFLSSRVPISAMLSFSSDFILILDNNLHILQINNNFLRYLGIDKNELLGNDISHPSLHFLQEIPLLSLLENEQKEFVTEITTTTAGVTHNFRAKVIPTVFDDGSQGLTLILEDITEWKNSERVKTFLASIVESSDEGIIGKDLEGKILSWNHAAESIFGYTAAEIIGKDVSVLAPPDYTEELRHIMEKIRQGKAITHLETKRMKKGGDLIDVVLTVSPIHDDKGNVCAASTIICDVSDIKKLKEEVRIKQEKLQEIIEFLPDPTFILDRNKKVLGWNKALEEFSGVKKQEILEGDSLTQLTAIFGTHRPLILDLLNNMEKKSRDGDPNKTRASGSISTELYLPEKGVHIWVKASPLYDRKGSFIGGIEYIKDISDWKKAEASLVSAQKLLQRQQEERLRILSGDNERLRQEKERLQGYATIHPLLQRALDTCDRKIFVIDSSGRIHYTSNTMAISMGVQEGTELVGLNIFERIDATSCRLLLDLIESKSRQPTVINCTFTLKGKSMDITLSVLPVTDDERLIGFVLGDLESLLPGKDPAGFHSSTESVSIKPAE